MWHQDGLKSRRVALVQDYEVIARSQLLHSGSVSENLHVSMVVSLDRDTALLVVKCCLSRRRPCRARRVIPRDRLGGVPSLPVKRPGCPSPYAQGGLPVQSHRLVPARRSGPRPSRARHPRKRDGCDCSSVRRGTRKGLRAARVTDRLTRSTPLAMAMAGTSASPSQRLGVFCTRRIELFRRSNYKKENQGGTRY